MEFVEEVKYGNNLKEGWGLTHNDQHLYMSDGTHKIYKIDPKYLSTEGFIEVHTEKGNFVF